MNLQQIADRIEIDDLLTRDALALDAKDWVVTNRAVTLDGDRADCRCSLFDPMGLRDQDGMVVFFDGGCYRDRLVRTAEGWRIAERVEEPTFSTRLHRVVLRPVAV